MLEKENEKTKKCEYLHVFFTHILLVNLILQETVKVRCLCMCVNA